MVRPNKDPAYMMRDDNPNPAFQPKVTSLWFKIKGMSFLNNNPHNVEWLLNQMAYHFFVHEAKRPLHLSRLIASLHAKYELAAGIGAEFKIGSISVTTEDDTSSRSLVRDWSALPQGDWDELQKVYDFLVEKQPRFDNRVYDNFVVIIGEKLAENAKTWRDTARENIQGIDLTGVPEVKTKDKIKLRNNVTPGPSHKSPIAYAQGGHFGFTIPGFQGAWIWDGPGKPPEMDKVVEKLARGLELSSGSGEAPDLKDKKLRKRVRQIIFEHTYADHLSGAFYCEGEDKTTFDILEEWASHVRKLIWKELKK